MALDPLKDLAPRYDVKGGNPKSPTPPYSVQEYQQYTQPVMNGGSVWKTLAGAAGGLWIMSLLAWWSAFQGKGITRDELRNEMKEYKDSISKDIATTNTQLGELKGKQDAVIKDLGNVQYKQLTDERDFVEFKTDTKKTMGTVADWMEGQKIKK